MIQVTDLVKGYGAAPILAGVSLTFEPGKVHAVIGPNGCGKSTLLRCIIGLEEFQAGTVSVAGDGASLVVTGGTKPPSETLLALRRRVGMVFQGYHLFSNMTVLDNVASGPIYALKQKRAQAEQAAEQALAGVSQRVNYLELRDRYPSQLSGGQQQRVAIARALAVNPSAVLFDEPTAALDEGAQDEVLDLLRRLAGGPDVPRTVVVVIHDMGHVEKVADHVHALRRAADSAPGQQVEFSGTTQDWLAQGRPGRP